MTMTKKWFLSRSLWVGVLEALGGALLLTEQFVSTGDFSTAGTLLFLNGLVVVLLRVITKTGLTR